MKQHTLRTTLSFSGVGLHSGKAVTMQLSPAPAGFGIRFVRTDLPGHAVVEARVDLVGQSRRGTMLSDHGVKILTPEHLLSALSGMGVDNALVGLDAPEVPILDGSARPFAEAIRENGLVEQDAERAFLVIEKPFTYTDPRSGSRLSFEPADGTVFDVTIDFDSQVVGVQRFVYDGTVDYATQVAPCRTFCFLHEINWLQKLGLIRGGSLDNALVVDEPRGYYGGKELYFDNELARHKLLDLMGDLALAGRPIRGKVTAYKPGHKVNTQALKHFLETL
jgi:UDP-3-O-[3-hydroxymyristoyl] N-acetylglucosamine deacetylase/3-hydroxyacyl-[acyl-carrier-protein] dehydratase